MRRSEGRREVFFFSFLIVALFFLFFSLFSVCTIVRKKKRKCSIYLYKKDFVRI